MSLKKLVLTSLFTPFLDSEKAKTISIDVDFKNLVLFIVRDVMIHIFHYVVLLDINKLFVLSFEPKHRSIRGI